MVRKILGGVAGLLVWVAVGTVAGLIMRAAWPAYASVADAMTFTLPMMFARLAIGALATLAMGAVTAVIAGRSWLVRLVPAALLLVVFIPEHIRIWDTFPAWYHLTFLVSLVPLNHIGGEIVRPRGKALASLNA